MDETYFNFSQFQLTLPAHHSTQHSMLDLHGFSPEQAKYSVNRQLTLAAEANITEFRFVTGRGNHENSRGERGTLYQEFPQWITAENQQKIAAIHKKDGYYEVHMKPVIKKRGIMQHFFEVLSREGTAQEIENIKKLAESGNDEYQFILGTCYQAGIGVTQDEKIAVQWFLKSAGQKNTMAQFFLGGCYWQGKGVRQNDAKAIEYFEMAALQDHDGALHQLGDCYNNGDGVEVDYSKAFQYYEKAANLGLDIAKRKLAHAYFWGRGVEKNEKKAIQLYQSVADRGDPHAAYNLACCYLYGTGVKKDIALCLKYANQAADKEDPDAQFLLSSLYGQGIEVKADQEKALKYLKKSADNGYKHALYQLAHQPEIVKDFTQHIHYLVKAAKAGQIIAQAMVLQMIPDELLRTNGLTEGEQKNLWEKFWKQEDTEILELLRDEDKLLVVDAYINNQSFTHKQKQKILRLLHTLVEQNHPGAMLRLGSLYMQEHLVDKNPKKAKEYWLKGSALGCDECSCSLGYYYEEGYESNGEPDYKKAFDYYQLSAAKGNANSHNQLGLMYRSGKGIEKNIEKAIDHFNEAMKLDSSKKKFKKGLGIINANPVFPHAAFNMGILYWNLQFSDPTPPKEIRIKLMQYAIYFLLQSEESGYKGASEFLDKIGIDRKERTSSYKETPTANFWKTPPAQPEKSSMTSKEYLNQFAEKMGLTIDWKILAESDKAWGYVPEDKIEVLKQYDIAPVTLRETTKGKYILLLEQLSQQNLSELLPTLKSDVQHHIKFT